MKSEKRHPCPYCGRLYTAVYRLERGVAKGSTIKVRDIEDHDCPAFRREPGNLWGKK
jgi:hypothetical protein